MTDRYFARDGSVMTQDDWMSRFGDYDYKRVAKDDLDDDVGVSTVWLGLNHQFGDGPPLIFETMIFGGDYGDYCWRYSTEADARAGHERIVASLRAGKHPDDDA